MTVQRSITTGGRTVGSVKDIQGSILSSTKEKSEEGTNTLSADDDPHTQMALLPDNAQNSLRQC